MLNFALRYFRHCLPFLAAVYLEDSAYLTNLTGRYGVPEGDRRKLRVLRRPLVPVATPGIRAPAAHCTAGNRGGLRVLWADGWSNDRERLDFATFARLNGIAAFDVLGVLSPDAAGTLTYDVVLFTRRHRTIPIALLRAALSGCSVVAPGADGLGELINEETGWPVMTPYDPEAYAEALRGIAAAPAEAKRRARNLQERAASQYSWQAYLRLLAEEPGFLGARRPTLSGTCND